MWNKILFGFVLFQVCLGQLWVSWEAGDISGPKLGNSSNPSGRYSSSVWVDSSRSLWMFGGYTSSGAVNDFWKYTSNTWSHITGLSSTPPVARSASATWADLNNSLWLYGGQNGPSVLYADLWSFSLTTNTWNQITTSSINTPGVFSKMGSPSPSNRPGSKAQAAFWIDLQGNLWIFGGLTQSRTGTAGHTNDMWSYNISLSQWTWVSGNDIIGVSGIYESYQTNITLYPGSRYGSSFATDFKGNFWLYGGWGTDGQNHTGYLSDLWMFNLTSSSWIWIFGSNNSGVNSVYGYNNISVHPGGRMGSVSWIDASNNFWLLGGQGSGGYFNDLWIWNQIMFKWVLGAQVPNQPSIYGTLHSSFYSCSPGARSQSSVATDFKKDTTWVFGGLGYDSTSTVSDLNDLWRYSIIPSFPPIASNQIPSMHNYSWPVIIFVLGGVVCILIGICFGILIYKAAMMRRMKKTGNPEPKKESEVVKLDDLNVNP